MKFSEEEIKKTISILKPNNQLFEVRVISSKFSSIGYFKTYEKLIEELSKQNLDKSQIYITLNTINEACYSRENRDRFINGTKSTSDDNITKYDWLFIDLDPERLKGISSSNEELQYAKTKAQETYNFLKSYGFEEPIIALSGNGIHLLYKICLENTQENRDLVKQCLESLSFKISDELINIDTVVFNPARIFKLYGTYARKGSDTEERPHRLSRILYVPKEIKEVSKEKIKSIVELMPKIEKETTSINSGVFDLKDFMSKNNIRVSKEVHTAQGTKYILEECIFNHEHKAPDSMIFQYNNGGIAYKCFHDHCSSYSWKDIRDKFEPNRPEYRQNPYTLQKPKEEIKVEVDDFLINVQNIKVNKISRERTLSGFKDLDYLIGGFTYDCVTLWAAQTNAGKTTLLTKLTTELVKQGRTVMYFNGEQTADNFKNNLYKQLANKNSIYSIDYKNTNIKDFYVNEEETNKIDNFINDKILIYNNDKSRDIDVLLKVMEQAREKYYCRDFIIDNLMQIDIAGKDVYREQERFTEKLRTFATNFNCNVHLVAHSRKTNSNSIRLTMFDISGTQAIANKAYNIITITRVDQINKDSVEYEKLKEDCAKSGYLLEECDGILEVLKTKGTGTGIVGIKYDSLLKTYTEIPKRKIEYKKDKKIKPRGE